METKAILCPLCKKGLTLDGFDITNHEDGTFSADPAVGCTHDGCKANFFIDRNRATFIPPPPTPPEIPLAKRR